MEIKIFRNGYSYIICKDGSNVLYEILGNFQNYGPTYYLLDSKVLCHKGELYFCLKVCDISKEEFNSLTSQDEIIREITLKIILNNYEL